MRLLKKLLVGAAIVFGIGGYTYAQDVTAPTNVDTLSTSSTTLSLVWNHGIDQDIPNDTTALSGDGSMYVQFSSNLLTNDQVWALEFRIDNYTAGNDYVTPIGDGGAADRGAIYWEASGDYYGFVNVSGDNPTNFNTSTGDLVGQDVVFFAYGNGTNVYYYVDGVLVETLTPTSGGTGFTLSTLFTGASDVRNVADGDIYYLKVWDTPTGTTITEIQAETPDNYFMINEGTGNTIADEHTAITGTVINPHANQWVGSGGGGPGPGPSPAADTFYLASTGANSYNGMHPDSAWKDLSYLTARVGDNTVGDSSVILINRGDTIFGSLPMREAIHYSTFGTGNKPIISGLTTLTNWTNYSGNIYYTIPIPFNAPDEVRFLTIDDVNFDKGREPNTELVWDTITSSSGNANLYDASRTEPFGSFVGGQVKFKESFGGYPAWKYHAGNITAFSGGNFTIGNPGEYGVGAGYPYFIVDHPDVLDLHGEWAYTTDTLFVYLDNPPANYDIKYSSEDILANITYDGVTIDSLDFQYANETAIFMDQVYNPTIQNSKTSYNYVGIFAQRSDSVYIHHDTVLYSTINGILIEAGDSINISYNYVDQIANNYTSAEDLPYGSGMQGIALRQYNVAPYYYPNLFKIYRNDVLNTGAAGIYFARTGNGSIIENTMVNCVQVNNDAGSMYAWKTDTIAEANVVNHDYDSTYVYRNFIGFTSDSLRFKHLWSNSAAASGYYGNYGYYFDDWCSNVVLRENMSVGTRFGMFLHSGWNNRTIDNIFIGDSATVEGIRSRRGGGSTTIYSGTDETYIGNITVTYGDGGSSYNVGYYGQEILDNFYFSDNRWVLLNNQASSYGVDDNLFVVGGSGNGVYTPTEWNTLTFANTSNDIDVNGRDNGRLFTYAQSGLSDIDSVAAWYYNTDYTTLNTTVEALFGSQYYYTDNEGNDVTGSISIPARTPYMVYRSAVYLGLTPPDTAQVFSVTSTKKDTITITASNFDAATAGVIMNYDTIVPASRTSGTILVNDADTSTVAGDHRVFLSKDDTIYVAMWHRNASNIWSSDYNIDTTAVDTAGAAPPGSAVTDDFTDYTSPLGGQANWTASTGTHNISSGRVFGDYQWTSITFYSGQSFNSNQYAEIELDAIGTGNSWRGGPMIRHNGGTSENISNCYFLHCWDTGYNLVKKQGSTYTEIVSGGSETFSAGDIVRLQVIGTTITMYKNDVQFGTSHTDSDLSSGSPGITTFGATGGTVYLDNFEANSL